MTQCIGSLAEEIAEQYLAGGLPEAEAERFENHYFACDACHEHLKALQDIRDELAREPIAAQKAASPHMSVRARGFASKLLAFPVPLAVLGSLAAALLFGAVLVGIQRWGFHAGPMARVDHAAPVPAPTQAGTPVKATGASPASAKNGEGSVSTGQNTELAMLVDLRLPGYQQPQLRGEASTDSVHLAFTAGMAAYAQGDCTGAVQSLATVPSEAGDGVAARLYSGLCQFKERELEEAQASFAQVAAAGDTPQLETAEYFLAQTRLLRGDVAGATSWLNRTIALRGDYEERAQKQLARLRH